jgi:hypothetical protein
MKHLLAGLLALLTSLFLFTACSDKSTPRVPTVPPITNYAQPSSDATNVLTDLIDAINIKHMASVLDLLGDKAAFIEHYPVTLGANLQGEAITTAYNGKGEIEEWLRNQLLSNLMITPKEYELVADNIITLEGEFLDSEGAVDVELVAYTQDGKIRNLFIYKEHQ